jgi:hypothetical protein
VQKILECPKCPVDERIKRAQEMADGLAAAAQSGDKASYDRLARLEKAVTDAKLGGDALAAFVTYREIQTKYFIDMGRPNPGEAQKAWAEQLAKFVQTYPNVNETPEALKELGLVHEFLGQEIQAKNWYQQLAKDFENHPLAELARGCIRRLNLEGNTFELTAAKMGGGQFDIGSLKGKIVLVYYWTSDNGSQCAADFGRLKVLLNKNPKDLELVCVNLDTNVHDAEAFVRDNACPGIQVCNVDQSTGLQSKLALQYGIQVMPHMFLVGKDGKVVNRSAQGATVADDIAKLLK